MKKLISNYNNNILYILLLFINVSIGQNMFLSDSKEIKMYVNVWGEVNKPGRILVGSSNDLLKIISFAGGPNSDANLSKIKITRTDPITAKIIIHTVNLNKIINSEISHPLEKIQIYPEDTIIISKKFSLNFLDNYQLLNLFCLFLNICLIMI